MKQRKISQRVVIEVLVVVAVVVLLKVVLLAVNSHINSTINRDTATSSMRSVVQLPVQSGDVTVNITHMEYHPPILVIRANSKVTWINQDTTAHTVTEGHAAAPSRHGFDSKFLAAGSTWSYIFTTPGTYQYTCEFHPTMNATIIVK